ncbi:MAG: hypothetical protein HOY75_08560 [Streptomyces sp.]|nr:hypothetical protein [Streptomyces sp.]
MTPPKTAPKPPAPDAHAEGPAAPLAVTVHDGYGPLPEHIEQLVIHWLRANRINPAQISIQHPILILPVPVPASDGGASYLIQVIAFHQFYVGPDGDNENNLLTHRPVVFQRTVPLIVALPDLPKPAAGGQADDAPGRSPERNSEEDKAA